MVISSKSVGDSNKLRVTRTQTVQLRRLVKALRRDLDQLVDRMIALTIHLPGYDSIPGQLRRAGIRVNFEWVARVILLDQEPPSDTELDGFGAGISWIFEQGVPVESMLLALQIAAGEIWREIEQKARELGLQHELLMRVSHGILRLQGDMGNHAVKVCRELEIEQTRRDEQRRGAFVRSLLTGTLSAAQLETESSAQGLSAEGSYLALRARSADRDALRAVERGLLDDLRGRKQKALFSFFDDDLAGIISAKPRIETKTVLIALGPPSSLGSINESFRVATRALDAASAFGQTGLVTFQDVELRSAVASEHDVSSSLYLQYVDPVLRAGRSGRFLLQSIEALFHKGMQVDAAAQHLYVHPNTLRYRLKRYEEITGANFADTETLFKIWWALQRYLLETKRTESEKAPVP